MRIMTIHPHDNLQQSPPCQKISKQITDLYCCDSIEIVYATSSSPSNYLQSSPSYFQIPLCRNDTRTIPIQNTKGKKIFVRTIYTIFIGYFGYLFCATSGIRVPSCGIWGIVKVLTSSTTRRAHIHHQLSKIGFSLQACLFVLGNHISKICDNFHPFGFCWIWLLNLILSLHNLV